MRLGIFAVILTLLLPAPAFADCVDDACGAMQKILQARSGNFAKLKGKPGVDARGDAEWEGTQTIPGLINYCYVYARGEGSRYEYRCDASGVGAKPSLTLEKAKQIAESVKTTFQSADPSLKWFTDPTTLALAKIGGFEGSEAWYGGYAPNKLAVKVGIFGSASSGSTVGVSVFAKFLTRRDVK